MSPEAGIVGSAVEIIWSDGETMTLETSETLASAKERLRDTVNSEAYWPFFTVETVKGDTVAINMSLTSTVSLVRLVLVGRMDGDEDEARSAV